MVSLALFIVALLSFFPGFCHQAALQLLLCFVRLFFYQKNFSMNPIARK